MSIKHFPGDPVVAYNAGYHRGLNTEYHTATVGELFREWLLTAPDLYWSITDFKNGFEEGLRDYTKDNQRTS